VLLVSATLAPLVGNISSERAIRESYFVVLKRDAKEDAGMYQITCILK